MRNGGKGSNKKDNVRDMSSAHYMVMGNGNKKTWLPV